MEVISKEEFLRACNQKIQQDDNLAEEERRRREEEERRRREEEERRRQQEEEQRNRTNAEWDAWYRSLPSSCKTSFVLNGFQYNVDARNRSTTKTPLLGDPRGRELRDDVRGSVRFSGFVNEELGI